MRPILLLVCAMPLAAPAQVTPLPQQSPRTASYDMTAEVEPRLHTLRGTQRIVWRNTTRAETRELRFHLYWNAFRDPHSTFMREASPQFRAQWREADFGRTEIEHLAVLTTGASGESHTQLPVQFVQPDDGNLQDQTVVRVALPDPVPPGGQVTIVTSFLSTIPKALRRFGMLPGGGVFLMHWYPVLGVLEEHDGTARWNCHQFHANTEFFGDFASYRVAVKLPQDCTDWVVGGTGGTPASTDTGDGRKTHTFEQQDVHNFAFVASPDFVLHEDTFGPLKAADDPTGISQRVAANLNVPVQTFDLPAVSIRLLLRRSHDTDEHRRRHLEAVKLGLEFFGLRYGPYPYPYVTAVDPGADVQGRTLGGGMEYATLFTCGTPLWLHGNELKPEGVTVHEFGHQFWYGLSANNEFEESWLDEGLNTYSEGRAQWLGYQKSRKTTHGRDVEPLEVQRFGLLPLAVSRGPWLGTSGLVPRRDVPGVWRIPYFDEARKLRFAANWRPESPLVNLLASQAAASCHPDVPYQDVWQDRARLLAAHTPDAMVRNGWEYLDQASYLANSYTRPATVLRTLERMLLPEVWWGFLREFHARSRFRHPTTADFTALLEERCGAKAANYFRSAIQAGATLDYGIVKPEPDAQVLVVRRKGTMLAEVKVRLQFALSKQPVVRTIAADDPGPVWRFPLREPGGEDLGPLTEAWIDPPELPEGQEERAWPAGVHLLDENLLDNAWRAERDRRPAQHRAIRALLQAQCGLSFAGWMGS